jgi:hypothetical protein
MKKSDTFKGILSPGDIVPGMYITVHHHKCDEESNTFETAEEKALFSLFNTQKQKNRTGMGFVYKVLAIQNPYILVEYKIAGHPINGRTIYDTRETVFMELNDTFMAALNSI